MTAAPFDPREFYEVAREAAVRSEEWYLRTAISRAYYACFHLAKRGLERDSPWQAGEANVHAAVIAELYRRRKYSLRDELRALRRLRERADYGLDEPVEEPTCRRALSLAATLMRRLETF